MRNESIFGLARARGYDRIPLSLLSCANALERFSHGANLIQFDKHTVGNFFTDTPLQALQISCEKVIANNLQLALEPGS